MISQENINDFCNFQKVNTILTTSKGNLRSRAVKKSAEWKCQHKKPTQHPTLLFWISYSTILKLQIFESSTHTKKHIASLAESESRVINSNTPPNVWKDHNHLSTKKPLSTTAPLIKNRSWCIKSRLGSQRTLTSCKGYWSVSYAIDHNVLLCM